MSWDADFKEAIVRSARIVDRYVGSDCPSASDIERGKVLGLLLGLSITEVSIDDLVDELKQEKGYDLREAAERWDCSELREWVTP